MNNQKSRVLSMALIVILFVTLANISTLAYADFGSPFVEHTVHRVDAVAFTANGLNTGEYPSSERLDVAGSPYIEAQVFLKRVKYATGDEELRIYFSVHDIQQGTPEDRIYFYFDQYHNHGSYAFPPPEELTEDVELGILRADCGAGTCSFTRKIRDSNGAFSGTGTPVSISNAQIIAMEAGEYTGLPAPLNNGWTGEFVLTPADLGWDYFPPLFGFLVQARSTDANMKDATTGWSPGSVTASYPSLTSTIVNADNPIDWANLKLRYPIDFGLIMDYSGSMTATDGLSENRWVRAKRAADLFAATLGLFKDPYFVFTDPTDPTIHGDRVAIMQYSWSCGDNDTTGNTTGVVSGLTIEPIDIPDPPTGTNSLTSDNATNPPGNNCTPIQQGLVQGLRNTPGDFTTPGMFGPMDPAEMRDRILVLLSDGFHNMPPTHSSFTLDPGAPFTTFEKQSVPVRTVAMGPDGSSGTDLMSAISMEFNGSLTHEAKYNNPLTFPELMNAYIETVGEPLKINPVSNPGTGFQPGEAQRLVFIAVWDDPSDTGGISVERDGTPVTPDDNYSNDAIGYTALVIDNPEPGGSWTLIPDSGIASPDQEYALADIRPYARFLIEQKPYNVGDTILLQVRINDHAQAVQNAHVTVETAKPGEALGNFLSTIQPDCSRDEPSMPPFHYDPNNSRLASGAAAASPSSIPASGSADPVTGRYALASDHMTRCNIENLERDDTLPGLQMFDDSSNGDVNAGDGIYSRLFTQTDLEGTYTFRFHVRGKTVDNLDFSRTRTTSQFVSVRPDRGSTDSGIQSQPPSPQNQMQTTRVFVLPKSGNNYLGPGFGDLIEISATAGTFQNNIVDHNNGYYSRTLVFDSSERPKIVAKYKGDTIAEFRAFKAYELIPFIGYTFFDNSLNLDDGVVVGARFGYRFTNRLTFELEGGATFTDSSAGDSGHVIQALLNARYDLYSVNTRLGQLTPYVTAGAGGVFFRGIGNDDDAFAYQGGVGATLDINESFGIRIDSRVLQFENALGAGSTTNYQATGGLVFRF